MTTSTPGIVPAITLEAVSKSFGAVRALEDVGLSLTAGEVRALVGENGAGKSTLVKILGGAVRPDSGQLLIDGAPVALSGPGQAAERGIAVIYQEPTLFPDLSISENIFMGRQPLLTGRRIDHRQMRQWTAALMHRLGVRLDPDRPARGLSIADQQVIEIAKALSLDARVIVMDEPTAALSLPEVERLFGVTATLRDEGAAILFVSHRLSEVFSLCQTVTIMRDGRVVFEGSLAGLTTGDLVRRMVGRSLDEFFAKREVTPGEVVLAVRQIEREGTFSDITLDVHRGEIVGLAGLVGAGRSEVARAIFGIDARDRGEVSVNGRRLPAHSANAAMDAGIAFVPEDRRQQGLVMDMSIARNTSLASLRRLRKGMFIREADENKLAGEWAGRLRLKYSRLSDPVLSLSGGNQQKVVLGKWLARDPKVLIVDEPTRGIDVGTKEEVHRLLSDLAAEGLAILMISSELPEILGMADRILVMHEGRLAATFSRADASEERIMLAATGGTAARAS